MGMVSVTLFDFDLKKDEPKQPITFEATYDENLSLEEQGVKKVAITVGNNVCTGTVTLPLQMLSALMSQAMAENHKRSQPSIIMPDNGIIRPN